MLNVDDNYCTKEESKVVNGKTRMYYWDSKNMVVKGFPKF